jgi:hypothetical protein
MCLATYALILTEGVFVSSGLRLGIVPDDQSL